VGLFTHRVPAKGFRGVIVTSLSPFPKLAWRNNRSRPERAKSIARSELWPRFAATQVPVDTSVDQTHVVFVMGQMRVGETDRVRNGNATSTASQPVSIYLNCMK
jgi:hypothetical protein